MLKISFSNRSFINSLIRLAVSSTAHTEGVGQLIKMTVEKGREIKPEMKVGVCGEHGGNEAGLTYVSCSPFQVPIARLAAAQASVEKAFDM